MEKTMVEYYDSIGWKPFKLHMCDTMYMEFDAQLVIRTKESDSPHHNDVFLVTLNWKQGHGDNWYFETEDGTIFKPDDVAEFLFDYS